MLKIERVNPLAKVPTRAHPEDAGLDLYFVERIVIFPNETIMVDTGWKMSVPKGYEIQIRSKSGLTFKKDLIVANSPGTVDAGYRGEVKVLIRNIGDKALTFHPGEKIAQMVICPVLLWKPQIVEDLDETERGDNSFGSTGF